MVNRELAAKLRYLLGRTGQTTCAIVQGNVLVRPGIHMLPQMLEDEGFAYVPALGLYYISFYEIAE